MRGPNDIKETKMKGVTSVGALLVALSLGSGVQSAWLNPLIVEVDSLTGGTEIMIGTHGLAARAVLESPAGNPDVTLDIAGEEPSRPVLRGGNSVIVVATRVRATSAGPGPAKLRVYFSDQAEGRGAGP